MLSIIPITLFFTSIIFRVLDKSIRLYKEIYPEDSFVWAVPLNRLKKDSLEIDDIEIKKK